MREMAKADYVARFVAYMLKHGGEKFDDGSSIEAYAKEMAPSYLADFPENTPEESADADMDCWEHEEA